MANEYFTALKTCTKCGVEKPVSGYTRDKIFKDGFRPSCKDCRRLTNIAYKLANPEKVKASSAAWDAANPDKRLARKRAFNERHRERLNAEMAVWRAANPGKLKAAEAARYKANPEGEKARVAAYREANKDKVQAYAVAYREANPGKVLAANAAWRKLNPERYRELCAAWRKANPDAVRVSTQNRRAMVQKNGGVISKGLAKRLFEMQKGMCPCCKEPLGKSYHLDHKMPLALGGTNTDDNMQLLRATCNLNKGAKHPVDFMQSRGYLI